MKLLKLLLLAALVTNIFFKLPWVVAGLVLVDIILNIIAVVNIRKRNRNYVHAAILTTDMNQKLSSIERFQLEEYSVEILLKAYSKAVTELKQLPEGSKERKVKKFEVERIKLMLEEKNDLHGKNNN